MNIEKKKSRNATEQKLDNREMSRILFWLQVLPFNTTWLFYKPRKITIYYDDSTVHIAVGGISVTGKLWKVYKIPFSKEFKVKSILPGLV